MAGVARAPKRILCAGASGFIGTALREQLKKAGHQVISVSRTKGADRLTWTDLRQQGLPDVDAVINLSGENILNFLRPWTASFKEESIRSRVDTTKLLAELIHKSQKPPQVFMATSAVGRYPPSAQTSYTENSVLSPAGQDFPSKLCVEIEEAAKLAEVTPSVRTVVVRMGIVLGKGGGAYGNMALPFKLGLGSTLGNGLQPFPWIHLHDAAGIYAWAVDNDNVSGVLNAVAPEQITNKVFSDTVASALGRPRFLQTPGFVLKALLHPERASMLLEGQRVVPERTLALGYRFQYADIASAARELAS